MVELQLEVGLTCAWWELPARCSCNSLFFKCLGGWVWNVAGAGLSLGKIEGRTCSTIKAFKSQFYAGMILFRVEQVESNYLQ